MSNIKKIFISIKSQIDSIADDFENHEALAEAAIKDLQQLAVTTRHHGYRVSKMVKQYKEQLNELETEATVWSERAIKVRDDDEQKALQCVKRLRSVKQQIEQINKQLHASENQEASIKNDQNAINEQLLQLKTKKEMLAARQNRSHLQKTIQEGSVSNIDIQGVFDRWEGSVVGNEYQTYEEIDPLSSTFEKQEDELELKLMLDELNNSQETQSTKDGE